MGLLAQNVSIASTPSGILDGHFPNGNDGSPLTWATVPSFLQKQVGTPFSIDLFATYLTQPGSPAATASVTPGFSIVGGSGWSLNSSGVLSYSGSGTGTSTLRVRATRNTVNTDSNVFTYESIPTIPAGDTLPPTIPTNPALVSKTTTTVTVNSDVPSDVPTATIPSSGLKEVRWYKNGVLDGVTTYATGLNLRFTKMDVSAAIGARKIALGHYTVFLGGQAATGIPNGSNVSNAGPITQYTAGLIVRYNWQDMEATQGNYNFSKLQRDIATCSNAGTLKGGAGKSAQNGGVGPLLFGMVEQKSFGGTTAVTCTQAAGQVNCTISPAQPAGQYGALFQQSGHTDIMRSPVTVAANGTSMSWTGALPSGGGISLTSVLLADAADNPLPDYLLPQSIPYQGTLGGGWVAMRWNATYLQRFDALVKALGSWPTNDPNYPGSTFDTHPNFAGVATQETANNGAEVDPGYTQANYASGLKAESDSIAKWLPSCRHLWYMNFMSGNTTSATSNLKDVAQHIWGNGAIVTGPDLVTSGSIVSPRCYPVYKAYHDGTAGAEQAGQGYTGCSVQPAEWAGKNPADGVRLMADLFSYGQMYTATTPAQDSQGTAWTVPSNLKLDVFLWNYQTSPAGGGQTFANAAVPVMAANAAPFTGTLGYPPSGMTPGNVTQTGVDYAVLSYGTGLGNTSDQFTCANNSVNGNLTVICKFDGMTGTDLSSSPAMGIRVGDASGVTSKCVYLNASSSSLRSRYRPAAGQPVTDLVNVASQGWNVPKWVKINRTTDTWTFFYSLDGLTWTACGSVVLSMVPTVYIQFFAGTTGTSSVTATFRQINVQQLAKINYVFTGLTTLTSYNFTATARDLALNESAASATLTVTTS